MTIESLPDFSGPAGQRWESIPADIRQRLLTNVWCSQCRHAVTIINFNVTMSGSDLLLVGKCTQKDSQIEELLPHHWQPRIIAA
jgi:hypothetical protein